MELSLPSHLAYNSSTPLLLLSHRRPSLELLRRISPAAPLGSTSPPPPATRATASWRLSRSQSGHLVFRLSQLQWSSYPRSACDYSTPSVQLSKAVARVSPASLSGSASRIRLFSIADSKSRSFMGDSLACSTVVSCSASLNYNGAPTPEARAIGTCGQIGDVKRVTKEMKVSVKVSPDGTGVSDSSTGSPFLDHMLYQLAPYGLFDVHVRTTGDVHIDDHDTTEDVALAIGTVSICSSSDFHSMVSSIVTEEESSEGGGTSIYEM